MRERLEKEEEFNSFLSRHQGQTRLVKFFAERCPPCHKLQKNLDELEKENPDLVILEVDVEKFPRLAQRSEFQVSSLPTLLLFRPQAAIVEKKVGLQSLIQLKEWVERAR